MTTKFKECFALDGVEYAVVRPTYKQQQEAQKVYNKAFRDAIDSKAILRERVDDLMREQNLWDDAKRDRFIQLNKSLAENEKKLKAGGKLSDAKAVALQMRRDRLDLQDLMSVRHKLDQNSAQAQAEDAKFNFLTSECTVYNSVAGAHQPGDRVFLSYDDYLDRQDDPIITKAGNALYSLLFNLDADFYSKLPENTFLKKYKLVNDKLELVNKEGELVDVQGRRIDADGYLLNKDGKRVDVEGNLLDAEGNLASEDGVFVDDEGKPVEVD